MLRRIGLSSLRERLSASSPHGYQSTGLSRCWRRYGLVSPARRLGIVLRHLECHRENFPLARESEHLFRVCRGNPAGLVYFMVVIGDITAQILHQEEMHKLVNAHSLGARLCLIPVFDLVDRADQVGLDAGLFTNLT